MTKIDDANDIIILIKCKIYPFSYAYFRRLFPVFSISIIVLLSIIRPVPFYSVIILHLNIQSNGFRTGVAHSLQKAHDFVRWQLFQGQTHHSQGRIRKGQIRRSIFLPRLSAYARPRVCTRMFSRSISATAAIIEIKSFPASLELSILSSTQIRFTP